MIEKPDKIKASLRPENLDSVVPVAERFRGDCASMSGSRRARI